jgi:hypothetical protein
MNLNKLAFFTMGVGSLTAGSYFLLRAVRRSRAWASGEGVIVGYRENEEASFFPKVQFRLPSGEERQVISERSGSPRRLPVGARVRVMYAPDRPEAAEVVSFSNLWILPMVLLGFGAVCILVGVYEPFVVR